MDIKYMIPEKWKKFFDSIGKKKIVLYDTFILTVAKDENNYLEQLQETLNAFFEKKEEILLLWFSKRFLEENVLTGFGKKIYDEIVRNYIEENWGIFVEEKDWNLAKKLANLYYGNDIAKVLLFTVEGKKTVFQNQELNFYTEALLEEEDFFWTFLNDANTHCGEGLFKISKKTLEVEYIGTPAELLKSRSFSKILKKDHFLYFIPFGEDFIAIYDIENNQWENITIIEPEYQVFIEKECKFKTGEFYENYLYMFSYCYPMIVRYNIQTKKLEYLCECTEKIINKAKIGQYYFAHKLFFNGRFVVFYSQVLKQVLSFDMKSNRLECLLDLSESIVYDAMEFDGRNYWLCTSFGTEPILKYNIITGEVFKIKNGIILSGAQVGFFGHSCVMRNFVWFLSTVENKAMKINIVTEEVTLASEFEFELKNRGYIVLEKDEEKLYAGNFSGTFIECNIKTGERQKRKLIMVEREKVRWQVEKISKYLNVDNFSQDINKIRSSLRTIQKEKSQKDYICGKIIWESLV